MLWELSTEDYFFKGATLADCRREYVDYLALSGNNQQSIISLECEFMSILFSEKTKEEREIIDRYIEAEVIEAKEKIEEESEGYMAIEADFRAAI